MNILITGGAGYVGSVLTSALLNQGFNIKVLDLMIYGEDVIKPHKNLVMIKGDIRNKTEINSWIEKNNLDIIRHLAAIVPIKEVNKKC